MSKCASFEELVYTSDFFPHKMPTFVTFVNWERCFCQIDKLLGKETTDDAEKKLKFQF